MGTKRAFNSRSDACSRRGFTLIEAIVAVLVVSIAAPATLLVIRDAMVRRTAPIMASRARWLAAERIEDVIADRHSATRGWAYVTQANYASEATVAGFDGFSRTTSVVERAADLASVGTGYKVVTVTVSWSDAISGPRSIELSTVLTSLTP